MCSIGGFICSKPLDPGTAQNLASGLLWYGSVRGEQSSGVMVDGEVYKAATKPSEFISDPKFIGMFAKPPTCVLTHTRQPTSGGRGDEQAQPFVDNHTVTVHNGGIFNIKPLKERFNINKPSGVDSELITTFISAHGINELPKFMEEMMGSAAIAAYVNNKLYLARDGNPLEYLILNLSGGGSILIFASTESILMAAARYVWLLQPSIRSITLPSNSLYECTPTKVDRINGWTFRSSYSKDSRPFPNRTYGTATTSSRQPTKPVGWTSSSDVTSPQGDAYWRHILTMSDWKERDGGVWTHKRYSAKRAK